LIAETSDADTKTDAKMHAIAIHRILFIIFTSLSLVSLENYRAFAKFSFLHHPPSYFTSPEGYGWLFEKATIYKYL
jgi:hypothetical protein